MLNKKEFSHIRTEQDDISAYELENQNHVVQDSSARHQTNIQQQTNPCTETACRQFQEKLCEKIREINGISETAGELFQRNITGKEKAVKEGKSYDRDYEIP